MYMVIFQLRFRTAIAGGILEHSYTYDSLDTAKAVAKAVNGIVVAA